MDTPAIGLTAASTSAPAAERLVMHPALKAMLTETVGHQSYTGQDMYGKPTYGPVVNRPGRVQYRITVGGQGPNAGRVSVTLVYFDADFALDVRDKLILPNGSAPAVQEVNSMTDPTIPGVVDHYEVLL